MSAEFVVDVVVALTVAVAAVRYWKAVLATVAVVVLALAGVGLLTVLQHWPFQR